MCKGVDTSFIKDIIIMVFPVGTLISTIWIQWSIRKIQRDTIKIKHCEKAIDILTQETDIIDKIHFEIINENCDDKPIIEKRIIFIRTVITTASLSFIKVKYLINGKDCCKLDRGFINTKSIFDDYNEINNESDPVAIAIFEEFYGLLYKWLIEYRMVLDGEKLKYGNIMRKCVGN